MGIYKGVLSVGGLITKDYSISDKELAKFHKTSRKRNSSFQGIFSLIFLLIIFISLFSRGGRRGLFAAIILNSLLGGRRGRSSGGGGFGGFGGFSGGGGGFGGGGASGGW